LEKAKILVKKTSFRKLIDSLIKAGYLKTPRIIQAFKKIKRADFVPEDIKDQAYLNIPLPIGFNQTISQPLTVAFMLELLQPEPEDKVLEIGSGSGWQTALLAEIVGKKGKVWAIERIPELKKFGENNVRKYNFIEKGRVEFICGDGSKGWFKEAPFDKIIAAAETEKIPSVWLDQLKINGRLVFPMKGSIWLVIKKTSNDFLKKEYPGFAFVPLIEE